jgi:glycosyltransferase involved in cell wall biosynthesis
VKVAHLTTTLMGGAGIAAVRMSKALNEVGVDSHVITQRASNAETSFISKTTSVLQRNLVQSRNDLITTFSVNSINASDLSQYDILHIHSIYNLINSKRLLKLADSKPLVITLHDQRSFTGGCHYSGDCKGHIDECISCPLVRPLFRKHVVSERGQWKLISNHESVRFISPSSWLANEAKKSGIANNKLRIIRNPIPRMKFDGFGIAKKKHGISQDEFVIGFVATQLQNPLKGLNDLISAVNKVHGMSSRKIILLLVGSGHFSSKGCKAETKTITNLDDSSLNAIYSSMDLLVVPSKQDNAPNVIAEALMCGVPVIGSLAGGIPELLEPFDLPFLDTTNYDLLSETILQFIEAPINGAAISTHASELFGFEKIGEEVKELYLSLL